MAGDGAGDPVPLKKGDKGHEEHHDCEDLTHESRRLKEPMTEQLPDAFGALEDRAPSCRFRHYLPYRSGQEKVEQISGKKGGKGSDHKHPKYRGPCVLSDDELHKIVVGDEADDGEDSHRPEVETESHHHADCGVEIEKEGGYDNQG